MNAMQARSCPEEEPVTEIVLPSLDEPCPYCTGPDADAYRKTNLEAWRAWNSEEESGYAEFAAKFDRTNRYGSAYDAWRTSGHYRDLVARQPEELPPLGCVECEWIGRRPTAAGKAILRLLATYNPKAFR
jgi:hypothetical protein